MSLSVRSLPRCNDEINEKRLALALAAHVLRAMAAAQIDGRRLDLDSLSADLGVKSDDDDAPLHDGVRARKLRREDVRAMITKLDGEGLVDALRMRLTITGFAMGSSLARRAPQKVMPLRLV
jgi:hypothetical protein